MVFPKSVSAKGSSTSSCVHIFITSSSHLLIFRSSDLLIFTSSLSLPFSLSLSLSVSCPLSLSLSFFFLSLLNPQAVPTRRNEVASFVVRLAQNAFFSRLFLVRRQPFRTKRGSSVKNCSKIAILKCRNEVRVSKTAVKLRLWLVRQEPFRTKCSSSLKN